MMEDTGLVLRGPPVGPVPDCSLGEYLLPKMRSLPQDRIIQVEAETGATQTVGELLEMGARVSEGLRAMGLQPGDVVGMMCMNGLDTTALVLGSWLSAAAIMPLPTNMTVGEIKYALEITQPKFLFCEEEAAKNAAAAVDALAMSVTMILMADALDEKRQRQSPEVTWKVFRDVLPVVDVDGYVAQSVQSPSTEIVTILFSSGTTGLPKAAGITHRNIIFQDLGMNSQTQLPPDAYVLQTSHFFWVTAHLFFLRTLTVGSRRVMVRTVTQTNVLKAIQRYKPLWTLMTPVFAVSLISHPDFGKYDISSLKFLLLGGCSLTPKMVEKIKEKWKGIEMRQCYGTTELSGTICVTDSAENICALGNVVGGLQLKVVDPETGKALKPNVLGEICVKSEGLMWGYLRNETMTKAAIDENGWFHTGDLGYYDDSKQVHLVDRMKDLIKMAGMQVAPGEVEDTILSLPGVLEVSVVGVTEDEEAYELMAFVVKEKDSPVTEDDVRERVAGTLSEYKWLTGGVVFVESLPKTPTGKLKKKEIREKAQELYSKRPRPKRTPTE